MHTRRTADYSPCRPGSKAENQAYNARREMMNSFASSTPRHITRPGRKATLASYCASRNAR